MQILGSKNIVHTHKCQNESNKNMMCMYQLPIGVCISKQFNYNMWKPWTQIVDTSFNLYYIASSTQSNVSWTHSEGNELPSTCIILVQGYIIKIPKCPIYGPYQKKWIMMDEIHPSTRNKTSWIVMWIITFFVINYKSFKHVVFNVC